MCDIFFLPWGWHFGVPAAFATAGYALDVFFFIDRGGVLALGFPWFPAAFATAGYALDVFFIFIDPCAGRHSLSLLRQRK
jgi:hypothetical protein